MRKEAGTRSFRNGKTFLSSDGSTSQEIIQRDPIVCSNIYRLLSMGYRYPTPGLFKIFQNGEFLDEILYNVSLIPELNAFMIEQTAKQVKFSMIEMTLNEFGTKYTGIFDICLPAPPCLPYEGIYHKKQRSEVMLEVSEFYNDFGLHMSQKEGKREFPDHICAELEFMHFLTFKEATGESSGEYLLAQKDFLERHLIQWIPKFCSDLQDSESLPFYVWLSQITSRFVNWEFELLQKYDSVNRPSGST